MTYPFHALGTTRARQPAGLRCNRWWPTRDDRRLAVSQPSGSPRAWTKGAASTPSAPWASASSRSAPSRLWPSRATRARACSACRSRAGLINRIGPATTAPGLRRQRAAIALPSRWRVLGPNIGKNAATPIERARRLPHPACASIRTRTRHGQHSSPNTNQPARAAERRRLDACSPLHTRRANLTPQHTGRQVPVFVKIAASTMRAGGGDRPAAAAPWHGWRDRHQHDHATPCRPKPPTGGR